MVLERLIMWSLSSAMLSVLRQSKEMFSTVQPTPTKVRHRGSNASSLWFLGNSKKLKKHLLVTTMPVHVISIAMDVKRSMVPWPIVFCMVSVPSSSAGLIHCLSHCAETHTELIQYKTLDLKAIQLCSFLAVLAGIVRFKSGYEHLRLSICVKLTIWHCYVIEVLHGTAGRPGLQNVIVACRRQGFP